MCKGAYRLVIATLLLGCVDTVCATTPSTRESEMEYLDNGMLRVGIDLSIGGAITYLAESTSGTNMINSFDWGRQV